jgi:hypothetical protein
MRGEPFLLLDREAPVAAANAHYELRLVIARRAENPRRRALLPRPVYLRGASSWK